MIKIIAKDEPKTGGGEQYRFQCPYCKAWLEADDSDLVRVAHQYDSKTLRFICPKCKCNRYVDKPDLIRA